MEPENHWESLKISFYLAIDREQTPTKTHFFTDRERKTYLFAISNRRCHQLSNRIEDNSELFIVLAFKLIQQPRKFSVRLTARSQLTAI